MAKHVPNLEPEDIAELGSSEETLETATNISTKVFSDITSLQLVGQKALNDIYQNGRREIIRMCCLPDGQFMIAFKYRNDGTGQAADKFALELLDDGMKLKFDFNRYLCQGRLTCPNDIAVFDREQVAVSFSAYVWKADQTRDEMNSVHIITVTPRVEIGPEIKLKYKYVKIACYNKRLYCYSQDLQRSRIFKCPGIEILASNGEVLKTVQMFENVTCFCPTKGGDIIYLTDTSVKCVSTDNTEVFALINSNVGSGNYVVSDIKGNIVVLVQSSGNVMLLNRDGSFRVLLDNSNMITDEDISSISIEVNNDRQRHSYGTVQQGGTVTLKKEEFAFHPMTVCFTDDYNKLIVTGYTRYYTCIPGYKEYKRYKLHSYKIKFD